MPPPTGVVERALDADEDTHWKALTVSSGSQLLNFLNDLLAGEDFHPRDLALCRRRPFPPRRPSRARQAAQMSGPVPSPRMNGMTGLFGTLQFAVC
jgi:hypothetical protein